MQVNCEYPDTDLPPTTVVFVPIGLGVSSLEVEARFRNYLCYSRYFAVQTVRDGLLPFCSETVRRVVVWDDSQIDLKSAV